MIREPWLFGEEYYWRAVISAASGRKDEALILFREALSRGNMYGTWIHTSPLYRHLHDYGAFTELMKTRD